MTAEPGITCPTCGDRIAKIESRPRLGFARDWTVTAICCGKYQEVVVTGRDLEQLIVRDNASMLILDRLREKIAAEGMIEGPPL